MLLIPWWGRWNPYWTNTEPQPTAVLRVRATVANTGMPKATVTR